MSEGREKGYFLSGLKALGKVKFLGRDEENKNLYRCEVCKKEIKKTMLMRHFYSWHEDVHNVLKSLMKGWGLVGSENIEVEVSEKRFYCECGKSYNRRENLAYHRRKKHSNDNSVIEIFSSVK